MSAALKIQVEVGIRDAIKEVDPCWPTGAIEQLIRGVHLFMEAAAQEEREACAKVAEEFGNASGIDRGQPLTTLAAANSIATLIRGRGEK